MKSLTRLLVLTSLAAGAAAQTTALVADEVWILEPGGAIGRPAALDGVDLLPLEFVGRTRLDELLPDGPRLRLDVPGAARVQLPGRGGSLYHFRRGAPTADVFGYFVVGADGRALPLLERAGTGVGGRANPFHGRVAIGPDGASLLAATTPAAGGDLFEVDWTGGTPTVLERSTTLAPLAVTSGGLRLGVDFGAALTATGVFRFDRAQAGDATSLPFSGATPADLAPDLVMNASGSHMAVLGGASPALRSVHVFGASGAAVEATAPAHLPGAGYLPDHVAGPYVALSPDGSAVAWRTDEGTSSECYLGPTQAGSPATHVTSDANFADTLNETGMIGFFSPIALIVLVGERDPGGLGHVEGGDFYRVESGPGATTITNVTLTSGDPAVPFLAPGELVSEDGIWRVPGTTASVLFQLPRSGGDGDLWLADLEGGTAGPILPAVKSLDLVERAGGDLFLGLRRSTAGEPRELHAYTPGQPTPRLLARPGQTDVLRVASDASGRVAAIAEDLPDEWLGRVDLATGAGRLLTGKPHVYGPALTFAPDGSVVATVHLGGGNDAYLFAWPQVGLPRLLHPRPLPVTVLPGN